MRTIQHGTANEYTNHGCRCDDCREAWRVYYSEYVKGVCPECGGVVSNRYTYKLCDSCHRVTSPPSVHGSEAYYNNHHCRCDLCRSASAAARRRRRRAAAA